MSQELTNSPQELEKEGSKSKETKKDRRIQKRANHDEMEHSTRDDLQAQRAVLWKD